MQAFVLEMDMKKRDEYKENGEKGRWRVLSLKEIQGCGEVVGNCLELGIYSMLSRQLSLERRMEDLHFLLNFFKWDWDFKCTKYA